MGNIQSGRKEYRHTWHALSLYVTRKQSKKTETRASCQPRDMGSEDTNYTESQESHGSYISYTKNIRAKNIHTTELSYNCFFSYSSFLVKTITLEKAELWFIPFSNAPVLVFSLYWQHWFCRRGVSGLINELTSHGINFKPSCPWGKIFLTGRGILFLHLSMRWCCYTLFSRCLNPQNRPTSKKRKKIC